MKVVVIGTGFVGVVTAAVLAKFGNQVYGLDIDQDKINKLKQSQVPFYEPELDSLLKETQKSGLLNFTNDYGLAVAGAKVVIVAVGTPSRLDGSVNLDYLNSAMDSLINNLGDGAVVVIKSTVPPGIFTQLKKSIKAKTKKKFKLVSMPEFLREGSAVDDTLHPDRIVIGTTDSEAFKLLALLHAPLKAKIIQTNPESAQLAKYAANAYLANRIAFINQVADLCQGVGANIEEVIAIIGQDKRIGSHYWYPGLGYGGSCFPKDVKGLAHLADQIGQKDNLFTKLDELNTKRMSLLFSQYEKLVGGFADKKVAVLGLAFKPETDDLREAPSLRFIPWLIEKGAKISAFDPKAYQVAQAFFASSTQSHELQIVPTLEEALKDVDVILILTEWQEFINFDYSVVRDQDKTQWIIDTRNRLNRKSLHSLGFVYQGVGV